MNHRIATAVAAMLVAGILAGPAFAQNAGNLETVRTQGMGTSREEAIADGMRKAVEQVAGQMLYSESQTRDYMLVRDSIIARAAGYVQSHEVLSTRQDAATGATVVELECVVSRQGIENTWGAVKALLQQMGRPKILVLITEKVDEVTGTVQGGRAIAQDSVKQVIQDRSTVQTRLENLLLQSGFELVDQAQLEEINRRDLQAALAEDDPARAQAIAKRFGAQLFIKGTVHSTVGLPSAPGGVLLYNYEGQANIRCYDTDSGRLLSSHSTPFPAPRGSGRTWRSGADMALTILGDQLAPAMQQDILRQWLDRTTSGGEVQLEISPVTLRQLVPLKRALLEIRGVSDVVYELNNNVAVVRIQTVHSARVLAEKLIEVEFSGKALDPTDISANVIRATVIDAE